MVQIGYRNRHFDGSRMSWCFWTIYSEDKNDNQTEEVVSSEELIKRNFKIEKENFDFFTLIIIFLPSFIGFQT